MFHDSTMLMLTAATAKCHLYHWCCWSGSKEFVQPEGGLPSQNRYSPALSPNETKTHIANIGDGDVPVPIDEATPLCHHRHPPLVTVGCGPSVAPDGPERTKTSSPSLSTDTRHGHHFNLEAAGRDEHESSSQDVDSDDECDDDEYEYEYDPQPSLSLGLGRLRPPEARNLLLLVLSFACSASASTLLVGGSAVAVRSVGGSDAAAASTFASWLVGSSLASPVGWALFRRGGPNGRRVGFLAGAAAGVTGAAMCGMGIRIESPMLVVFGCLPLGVANGVGLHLRYAAVEVVPPDARALAVGLVLGGGCVAALAGPESGSWATTRAEAAQAMTSFDEGDGDASAGWERPSPYLGLFVAIAAFNAANAALVSLVHFPDGSAEPPPSMGPVACVEDGTTSSGTTCPLVSAARFARFLLFDRGSSFLVPLGIATLCWAIMACPMSVLRVAMGEAGYPDRLSLTAIEFHFLGMYFPGFWAGTLMDRSGVGGGLALSCLSFASACGINLLLAAPPADPSFEGGDGGGGGVIPWMAGMVFLGVGWNLGFAGSTVMLSASSKAEDRGDAETARAVQAANDFLMFLLSGTAILSTGYVYEAGGRGMDGWVAVNSVALGLVGVLIAVVLLAAPR